MSGEGNATEKSVLSKRRRSEDVEMVDKDQAEEMLKEINQQFQFPRLLSSRKLLELEVSMILCHVNAYADSFIDRRYTIQTQCHCPVFDSIPIPVWIQGIWEGTNTKATLCTRSNKAISCSTCVYSGRRSSKCIIVDFMWWHLVLISWYHSYNGSRIPNTPCWTC